MYISMPATGISQDAQAAGAEYMRNGGNVEKQIGDWAR